MIHFILVLIGSGVLLLVVMYFVERKTNREIELINRLEREIKTMSNKELLEFYNWFSAIDNEFPYDVMLELCSEEMKIRKKK